MIVALLGPNVPNMFLKYAATSAQLCHFFLKNKIFWILIFEIMKDRYAKRKIT